MCSACQKAFACKEVGWIPGQVAEGQQPLLAHEVTDEEWFGCYAQCSALLCVPVWTHGCRSQHQGLWTGEHDLRYDLRYALSYPSLYSAWVMHKTCTEQQAACPLAVPLALPRKANTTGTRARHTWVRGIMRCSITHKSMQNTWMSAQASKLWRGVGC